MNLFTEKTSKVFCFKTEQLENQLELLHEKGLNCQQPLKFPNFNANKYHKKCEDSVLCLIKHFVQVYKQL